MSAQQDWHTESYKGMDVYVTALARDPSGTLWDYSVRVIWPAIDPTSASEIVEQSGDDADYQSKEAAIEAGFVKGYAMVDRLTS